MSGPRAGRWWHDRGGGGVANLYRMDAVERVDGARQTLYRCRHGVLGETLIADGTLLAAEHAPVRAELLAHIALAARDGPQRVLIVGGGGGALLREALRHDAVTGAAVLEPDPGLVTLAGRALGAQTAFDDRRARVVTAPAALAGETFDVILYDADDGGGRPRAALAPLLADERRIGALLADGGVAVDARPALPGLDGRAFGPAGGPRPFDRLADAGRFAAVHCFHGLDPLAPGGTLAGYLYAADGRDYRQPRRDLYGRHYTPELHRAAFALPRWLERDPHAPRREPPPVAAGAESWIEQTQNTGLSQALTVCDRRRIRSAFQTVEFFRHPLLGRALALDGTVQCTEADEYIYHEMATLIALYGRARAPRSVRALIVGGGDGGVLRELLAQDCVAAVTMVEIDRVVVDGCREHLGIEGDYDDPRARLIIGDAADYVATAAAAGERFELIVVDATDSTTPSSRLWNDAFFTDLYGCLSDDGVCVDSDILIHGARTLLSRDVAAAEVGLGDVARAKRTFASVQSVCTRVPTFPGGWFALFLYSKDGHDYSTPRDGYRGRHYTPELHRAAFALPPWWRALLDGL